MRVLEEALELARAVGVPMSDAHIIYRYVYTQEHIGEVEQEHAGVMVSLLASATANGVTLEKVTQDEIDRIWLVPEEKILAKQAVKNRAGITKYYRGEANV